MSGRLENEDDLLLKISKKGKFGKMKVKYKILYTHQKTKKRKTWQDGILIVAENGKTAALKNDAKENLGTVYIKKKIEVGCELESAKYLIQIDELFNEEESRPKQDSLIESEDDSAFTNPGTSGLTCSNPRTHSTTHIGLSQPSRKRTKFVIPRKVTARDYSVENFKSPSAAHSTTKNSVCDVKMEASDQEQENIWTNVEHVEDEHHETSTICDQSARSTEEVLEILRKAKRKKVEKKEHHTPQTNLHEENKSGETSKSINTPANSKFVSPVKEVTLEDRLCQNLFFSTPEDHEEMEGRALQRTFQIPLTFPSVHSYVKALREAIHEHLNITLWKSSEKYHSCLAGADLTNYAAKFAWSYNSPLQDIPDTNEKPGKSKSIEPLCQHGIPGKLLTVNKEGKNKGRYFYVCSRPRRQGCKFFKWQEDSDPFTPSAWSTVIQRIKLNNERAVTSYMKRNGIDCYCECTFVRKTQDVFVPGTKVKVPAWIRKARGDDDAFNLKGKIYIKLSRKEPSSAYHKDDIWVISRTLFFKQSESFVARSSFHGPSSNADLEIQPIGGYTPSQWTNGDKFNLWVYRQTKTIETFSLYTIFALLVYKASNELSCLRNLQDLVSSSRTFPLLPDILNPKTESDKENEENPTLSLHPTQQDQIFSTDYTDTVELAKQFVLKYGLNEDQSQALNFVVDMICEGKKTTSPIMLVHGVFGSGKSFLLSVIIIFLSEITKRTTGGNNKYKILLSTLTNVAVDRVLLSLLDIGFTSFCRVGSLRKIASRVLPHSVHMTNSEHTRELQNMLGNPDLSQQDKYYIKLSLKNVRSGMVKDYLNDSILVAATCAATNLACLKNISFPLVILDECTQCTEPLSLLPLSNFNCKSMILCGDPNQLPPTIEGSNSSHKLGLEQTLFNRLVKVGHVPIMLTTQYRCHPQISRIAGNLFYDGKLKNGITDEERPRILKNLPNLAFYDLLDGRVEQDEHSSSVKNPREASFVSDLVKLLLCHGVPGSSIGVITMYRAQVQEILSAIQLIELPDLSDITSIQVSTVDAFQGAEKDIIILSCVLTSGSSGFLDSEERMCVALTRARNHLLIVGHKRCLSSSPKWQYVIKSCGDCVQTYFQFRKLWGKKLEKTTVQENCNLLLSQCENSVEAPELCPVDTDEKENAEPMPETLLALDELHTDNDLDS